MPGSPPPKRRGEGTAIPGFVDLQINGWCGVDFSDPALTKGTAADACRSILASGTVGFLATIITAPVEVYRHNVAILASLASTDEFQGRLLGIHLEGPFLSPAPGAVGCHPKEHIRPPDQGLLEELHACAHGHLKLITIAANIPGSAPLAARATQLGIRVALGHQLATSEDLAELAEAGAAMVTHLGNGMPNQMHRHNNVIFAAAANDRLSASIITDGFHLPPDVIKVLLRSKGVHRLLVVSDAAPIAGLPPGRHACFGREFNLEEPTPGRCVVRDPERDCLAGSGATMLQCMNYLHSLAFGLSLADLEDLGCHNPLAMIGMTRTDLRDANETKLSFVPASGFTVLPASQ